MTEIQSIPPFDLPATVAGRITGETLLGSHTVFYFYPKDNTSGCTIEAVEFTSLYPRFQKLGAKIIGVSRDSLRSHERFAQKHEIPYPLIADTEEILCRAFDVLREKSLYGRKYRGIDRSTFLFDRRGRLRESWRAVRPPGHAEAVLDRLTACIREDSAGA
ncbi:MAG: peroxiredoxin [Gammaproteobacteria bacterium]